MERYFKLLGWSILLVSVIYFGIHVIIAGVKYAY